MADKESKTQEEARKKLVEHVVAQIKVGKTRAQITTELTQSGVEQLDADRLVDAVHGELLKAAELNKLEPSSIPRALIAAGLAAIIGGVIWGLIVIVTDYEIGFMATGIGVLAGYAVNYLTNRRGIPLQIIAVAASLIGILIGKYITFYSILREYVTIEFGSQAADQVKILSTDVIQFFFENITDLASPYDLLWIALAVIAAWRIPQGIGWQPPKMF